MAESLGGSRGKGGNASALGNMMSKTGVMLGSKRDGAGGGILGGSMGGSRPASASPGLSGSGRPTGRPSSAPRERMTGSKGGLGITMDARARVEESRQVKEAGYWGRELPVKREVPAYWSMATYGQPFHDERLAMGGATNVYQILTPDSGKPKAATYEVVGPATEQQSMLRKSLMDGKRLFNRADLTALPESIEPEPLAQPDRVFLLHKLTPYQRIHALCNCLDRDTRSPDFTPWTQMVWDKLDAKFWKRQKELAIRMAQLKLENLMRRHLRYLVDQRCMAARAPASRPKDILREEFWHVDPDRTGLISMDQFLQVWQARLCLLEYTDEERPLTSGKTQVVLRPGKRFIMDESMAAALFVKYGFDKDGLMPYAVFSQALSAAPCRLLGQELVLDKNVGGKNGLSDDTDIGYVVGGAKVLYPKSYTGVFPPSKFDPRVAERSQMLPKAHMWLEHIYGYPGHDASCSNVFYTCNTKENVTEIVYYTGAVGVVFNKELFDQKKPSQKFFFGHDNDIECINIHPNRRFVVTGQQKATGPHNVPYVCIWDLNTCNQLQRLNHDIKERAVIAVCFSGNINAAKEDKLGGEILVTVTADDKHTVHVWRWMIPEDKYCRAQNIPGWCFGPERKIDALYNQGLYYDNPEKYDLDKPKPRLPNETRSQTKYYTKPWAKWPKGDEYISQQAATLDHPLLNRLRDESIAINADWEDGYCTSMPQGGADKTFSMTEVGPGCNGTPPMVYGVVWNPLRPSDGRRGSEFASYGVKHLKTWVVNDQETWQGTSGSFGTDNIENVLSACYVPALHYMAAPGDSCLLTGFSSGQMGLWIPPFPTRAGSTYQLTRMIDAHGPGNRIKLNDGSQVFGGVRVIKLRADPTGVTTGRYVVTGGADGYINEWELGEVFGTRSDGSALRGVNLKRLPASPGQTCSGPETQKRYQLTCAGSPYNPADPPMVVALDTHPAKTTEYIAGTRHCDIWEVDDTPRILVEGHEEDIWRVATHPTKPNIFASTCESGKVRVWDTSQFDVICTASVGFPVTGITFSNEEYGCSTYDKTGQKGFQNFHIAVGSTGQYALGDWHKVAIMDASTLQPLKILKEPTAQVSEIKYSPPGGPAILAAGSQDMTIYLYNCKDDYKLVAKCVGHAGCILHLDWTLPISLPGTKLHGKMILRAVDESANLLYWDPKTGRKVTQNQRDASMHTMTARIGFEVMGIWDADAGFEDVNSTCASRRGFPKLDLNRLTNTKSGEVQDAAVCVNEATEEESADGVPGGGYLLTADDKSNVKLFNYPVVWDDAPFKLYRGHASHVMWVRFSNDDRIAISAGGHDRGLYQWRTIGINMEDMDGLEKDRLVLVCMDHLITKRREGATEDQPKPGVNWGPLDEEGKVFGPTAVKKSGYSPPSSPMRQNSSPSMKLDRSPSMMKGGSPGSGGSFSAGRVSSREPRGWAP